jgi:hypothetical protein
MMMIGFFIADALKLWNTLSAKPRYGREMQLLLSLFHILAGFQLTEDDSALVEP